jgi:uncharacterized membrane protein
MPSRGKWPTQSLVPSPEKNLRSFGTRSLRRGGAADKEYDRMSTKHSVFRIAGALALTYTLPAIAQQTQEPGSAPLAAWGWHGPWQMCSGGWGFWWIFPLIMFLFFVGCAALLRLGRSWGGGMHHQGPPWHTMDRPGRSWSDPTYSALQILNERYAKGEIAKQEYEERTATILGGRGR